VAAATDTPQWNIAMNTNAIGRPRIIKGVVKGSGRILATRVWIEKNDPAAMNSPKHMRHRCRASRGPPRRGFQTTRDDVDL